METRDTSLLSSIEARIKAIDPKSTIELKEGPNGPFWLVLIPNCPILESQALDATSIWIEGIELKKKRGEI